MDANIMNPDQTALLGAVRSKFILFVMHQSFVITAQDLGKGGE